MIQFQVDYQRKAYPGLSATLAWTLEEQADVLMRHIGFGSKMLASDRAVESELVAQIIPIFDEAMAILELMFGNESDHYRQVEKKRRLAQAYMEKSGKLTSE